MHTQARTQPDSAAGLVDALLRRAQGTDGCRRILGEPTQAHAVIGWVRDAATGAGLFVELHDPDRNRLDADPHATLVAMQVIRGIDYGAVHTEIATATCGVQPCGVQPVCALLIVVFGSEPR